MLLAVASPLTAFAGRVRTLPTNSQEMPVIHLMTGRSTVLRFSSPPKKVVIGNQNYFSIEFIDSDVTLQPLANTTSNLFVYGDGFTYGFILKVGHSSDYDDLVFVRSKVPNLAPSPQMKTAVKPEAQKKDLRFLVSSTRNSKFDLEGEVFRWNQSVNSYYADLFISLKSMKPVSTDSIKILILSENQDVTTIKSVFEKDQLLPKTKGRARVFANITGKQALVVKVRIDKEEEVFNLKWKK